MLISSQRYRDQDIVNAKRAARDYAITVVTISDDMQVVIDGHHSLSAALEDGVEPVVTECKCQDTLYGLEDIESWLDRHWMGDDWHDPITGRLVF